MWCFNCGGFSEGVLLTFKDCFASWSKGSFYVGLGSTRIIRVSVNTLYGAVSKDDKGGMFLREFMDYTEYTEFGA